MYQTLKSILIGRRIQTERRVETTHAATIIEQKIDEAESGHASAKRGLAAIVVKIRSEEKALSLLIDQIDELTDRTRQALRKENETLAREAAVLIAQLEDERLLREQSLTQFRHKADRIRLAVERNHHQLIALRQGLVTAQSIQRERTALSGVSMPHGRSVSESIREGEAVLTRLLASDDPVALDDALAEIDDDLSGQSVLNSLAEAGCGAALKTRPHDVLERLRADITPADA